MAEHIHSFEGGMDQDTSAFKYPKNKYFEARNMRLTVDEESQQYSLTTIDGNEDTFTVQNHLYHGHGFIRDSLVLFLLDPSNTADIIIEVDPLSPALTGSDLNLSNALYSGDLGFTVGSPVSVVGGYEGSNLRKIYFVDGVNPLRTANLDRDYMSVTHYAADFNLIPPSDHEGYELIAVKEGGNLKAGLVQYSYFLYNKNGPQTYFAPPSVVFPITKGSVTNLSSYVDHRGGIKEEVCNRSFEFEITNNAPITKFDYIQVVGIYYEDKSINPVVKVIGDYDFTSTTMRFIDTGDGYSGEYTAEEFTALRRIFTAGSIKSKDNYLFAADITEETFDVDIDCRAYRFDSNGKAKLLETDGSYYLVYADATVTKEGVVEAAAVGEWEYFNAAGVYQTVTGLDWSIPETADCICPSNYIENDFPIDQTSGTHTGGNNEAILTFGTGTWVIDSLIGATISNITDGSSGVITDNDGTTITATLAGGTGDDWDTNDIFTIDVSSLWFQYKYKSDGYSGTLAFGATGKNTEVTISQTLMNSDIYDTTDYTTHIAENKSYIGSGDEDGKNQMYQHQSGSMTTYSDPDYLDTYADYASPFLAAYRKSFLRDEIYRKAIVFSDNYGRDSYAKWVCDLRMPRTFDTSGAAGAVTWELFGDDTTNIQVKGITPLMNVQWTSELSSANVVGYKTVYVPRTSTNSTILDNGIVGSLEEISNVVGEPEYHADYNATGYVFPTSIANSNWIASSHMEYFDETEILLVSPIEQTWSNRFEDNVKEYISPDINYGPTSVPTHGPILVGYSALEGHISAHSFTATGSVSYAEQTIYFKKYNEVLTEGGNNYALFNITDFAIFSDSSYNGGNKADCYSKTVGGYKVLNYSKGAASKEKNDQARGTCGIIAGTPGNTSTGVENFTYDVAKFIEPVYVARKQIIEPYGGLSYEDRLQNTYEECSPYGYFNGGASQTICSGDTYIGMMEHIRTMLTAAGTAELDSNNLEIIYFPCESTYNIVNRTDSPMYRLHNKVAYAPTIVGVHEVPGVYELDDSGTGTAQEYEQDWYLYDNNNTYSRNNFVKTYIPAPLGFTVGDTYRYDTKVIASEQKSNRELIDSWTKFLFSNEVELNTGFGPITNLELIGDNLIAIQEKAIASISVNEREQIIGETGVPLTLGTGTLLERFDYISTTSGCQSKFGHVVTPMGLYYYDGNNKGIFELTTKGGLSIGKATFMDSYFKNQSYSGFDIVAVGYNREHNEILFTFTISATGLQGSQETLAFNDLRRYFTQFTDTLRTNYVYDDRILFSLADSGIFDISFFKENVEDSLTIDGYAFDCDLTIISRPEHPDLSRFDILEWNSIVKATTTDLEEVGNTFNTIQCTNTYQDTGILSSSNLKRRMRLWRLNTLRDAISARPGMSPRLRSEWLKTTFSFTPASNKIWIDSIKAIFQPNKV